MKKVEIYYSLTFEAADRIFGVAPTWDANGARYLAVPGDHPRYAEALAHADVADDFAAVVSVQSTAASLLKRESIPTIDEAIDALGPAPVRTVVPVLGGAGQVRR